MKGLFCFLILFAASAGLAKIQHPRRNRQSRTTSRAMSWASRSLFIVKIIRNVPAKTRSLERPIFTKRKLHAGC